MERDTKKNIIITLLVILGFIVTIDLAVIYYSANFDQFALPSFCSVSDLIDCDGVARTVESQFLGVPLAYWGMFLYAFIIMLLLVDKLKRLPFLKFLEVFKNKFHYIASLGIISFTISMILLCVSLFGIHKICVMCAVTYVINLCIGLVAVRGIEGGFIGSIKQSFIDFADALKPIPYRIAFIIVMLLAGSFLSWTFFSAKFSPALNNQRQVNEYIKVKTNKYAVKGNFLGSRAEDAVVVNVYSDYKCPMCRVFDIMIHKAVTEFENIRVEHHALPLDIECNRHMTQPFHEGSCIMAKYAEAAYEQGKFWEVHSLFFEKKPTTEDEVIETLYNSDIDLDMDKLQKDAHSKVIENKINYDIDVAVANNHFGTPTMNIGKDFNMGIPTGGYDGLKEWIKERGGIPKHHKLFR